MTWPRVSSATSPLSTAYQMVSPKPLRGLIIDEKHRREVEAMDYLTSLLPGQFSPNGQLLRDLFDEYEEGTSPESILVKDVDKYELLVQAVEYERDSINRGDRFEELKNLTTFFGVKEGLKTDLVKGWAEEIMKERETLWKSASKEAMERGMMS